MVLWHIFLCTFLNFLCKFKKEELVEEGVAIQLTDEDDIWNAGAIKEELAIQGV